MLPVGFYATAATTDFKVHRCVFVCLCVGGGDSPMCFVFLSLSSALILCFYSYIDSHPTFFAHTRACGPKIGAATNAHTHNTHITRHTHTHTHTHTATGPTTISRVYHPKVCRSIHKRKKQPLSYSVHNSNKPHPRIQ
jgi:hypothetical protein